ncbi:uncharacterized protein F54H12.2 [Trichonephila clavipes]|nr:uncharacterized protein F54H12.2 [Trichonephila clavipes]
MLVPYKCCVKQYEDYYVNQAGNGLSYYQGQPFQKGYGIGVNDLLEGQNLEDAAKHRTKETGRKLAREAIKKADDMLGQGKKYKRKKRFSKHIIPSKARKAKGRDIFDT